MFRQGVNAVTQVHALRHVFDPNILDTAANVLKATTGTIATNGTEPDKVWRVNEDEIYSYDMLYPTIDIEFAILFPDAPTSGDSKSWGLKSPGLGNRGRVGFDITDDVFSAVVYDELGNQELSKAITWDGDWSNAETRFRIQHKGREISFLVNETEQARYPTASNGQASNVDIPLIPLPLHFQNDDADNMDVYQIIVRQGFNA